MISKTLQLGRQQVRQALAGERHVIDQQERFRRGGPRWPRSGQRCGRIIGDQALAAASHGIGGKIVVGVGRAGLRINRREVQRPGFERLGAP